MDHKDVVRLASEAGGDLASRIDFLLEIDKLKSVLRRSLLTDGSRLENTAEHSWHLAMFAMILAPYAEPDVDPFRAMEILLIHDLVEIDAGDTYIYDDAGRETKEANERAAAERIFNLLPPAQADHIAQLWDEYEERSTPTARFAYAVDRLQPLLLNASSGGASWLEHGIRHGQAAAVNAPIGDGSQTLWQFAERLLATAADEGLLADDRP
jgi:putative hydrolase of HD superfamily